MAKVIKISHTLSEVWDICAIIYKFAPDTMARRRISASARHYDSAYSHQHH